MKQKILFFVLLCTSLLLAVSCGSFSETEYALVSEGNISADGFIYDKYENSTVRITGTEGKPAILIIPSEIDGMAVVGITDSAFAENEILLYAEFPETKLTLGKGIFEGCTGLATVKFSSLIEVIPSNMFNGCRNLVSLDQTDSITEIGNQSFADCAFLTSFSYPKLTSLGDEAFRGCTSITSIVLPKTLTFMGKSAFWGCSSLVSAVLDCTADISEYSFIGCNMLTDVSISSAARIGDEGFRGCTSLHSITIGENLKHIGDSAFYGCDELTEIKFEGNMNDIEILDGNEALSGKGGDE